MTPTINIKMTWQNTVPVLLALIENGDAKGRATALAELTRMAVAADMAVAAQKPEDEQPRISFSGDDKASWLAPIWNALHGYRENCIPEGEPRYDAEWGDITTCMAWIAEELGVEEEVEGY